MSNNSTLKPVSEGLMSFLDGLAGLARFDKRRKNGTNSGEYFPSAGLIMELGKMSRDWDISFFPLFKKNGYVAEIWTDIKTFRQLIVAFWDDGKGLWPVAFEAVEDETALNGVFEGISQEMLAKRCAAALRSLKDQGAERNLALERKKHVA